MRPPLAIALTLALAACRDRPADTHGAPGSRAAGASGAAGSAGSGGSGGSAGSGAGSAGSGGSASSGAGSAGSAGSAGGGSAATAGSAAARDPWAAAPKPPDTPESRQRRAEAALGRVAKIEPEVAVLRHLGFERAVPTRYQKPDEFRAFVRREIAKDLPPARSRDLTQALAHLGFLAHATDLAGVEEQAMTTQAGAYYDPAAKAFFVVMVPETTSCSTPCRRTS
jgi:hypothetical protein